MSYGHLGSGDAARMIPVDNSVRPRARCSVPSMLGCPTNSELDEQIYVNMRRFVQLPPAHNPQPFFDPRMVGIHQDDGLAVSAAQALGLQGDGQSLLMRVSVGRAHGPDRLSVNEVL